MRLKKFLWDIHNPMFMISVVLHTWHTRTLFENVQNMPERAQNDPLDATAPRPAITGVAM